MARPLPLHGLSTPSRPARHLVQDAPHRPTVLRGAIVLLCLALSACKGGESAGATSPEEGAPGWAPNAKLMASAGSVVITPSTSKYVGGAVAAPGAVTGTIALATALPAPAPL